MLRKLCRKAVDFVSRPFKALGAALVTGTALVASNAQAQAITDGVVAAFTDAQTGVAAVAAVMLGVVAAGITVKWILGFIIS